MKTVETEKRCNEAAASSDLDDDIEIVEPKPEVIEIDDNDEAV